MKGHMNPYFNPRSPCGERTQALIQGHGYGFISIRTPRAGSVFPKHSIKVVRPDFNPHSPCGERNTIVVRTGIPIEFQSALPVQGA